MLAWWKWAVIFCAATAISGCKNHFICQGQIDPVGDEEPYIKTVDAEIDMYPVALRAVFKDIPLGTLSFDDGTFNYVAYRVVNNSIWFSASADDATQDQIGQFNRVTGTLSIETILGSYEMNCEKANQVL